MQKKATSYAQWKRQQLNKEVRNFVDKLLKREKVDYFKAKKRMILFHTDLPHILVSSIVNPAECQNKRKSAPGRPVLVEQRGSTVTINRKRKSQKVSGGLVQSVKHNYRQNGKW